jgi:hypothetical protein
LGNDTRYCWPGDHRLGRIDRLGILLANVKAAGALPTAD